MNQQSNNRISIMRDEPVAASLMKLGVPTMIGMLISALYNAIDAYFVGGLGMSQMGVSVVFPIVQIVIGLGMMFGAGASSYISRSLGKGDNAEANRAASTALFASVLVGAVIITGIMVSLDPVPVIRGHLGTASGRPVDNSSYFDLRNQDQSRFDGGTVRIPTRR